MKKSRNILILTAVVLISSIVFCLAFTGISKMNNSSNAESTIQSTSETASDFQFELEKATTKKHSDFMFESEEVTGSTSFDATHTPASATTSSLPKTTQKYITTTTTKQYKNRLDISNASLLLSDAVYCYDCFLNTTTFNLRYDYYGEYIICPHCGDQAFLVKNYNSYSELNAYINKYLTGEAKDCAEDNLQECINYGMLTEYNGNLYVCGMYNDRGYSSLDCNSILLLTEYSDGSCFIAVNDSDNEETYYLTVFYINGEYKVG